jgi:hypothetical protein
MTKHYTDLELMSWRPVKNVGSATINPREVCLVCTGGDSLGRSITAVKQPTSTAGKSYCVNGPTSIAAGKFGRACFGPVVLVKYDTGSPATDDQYGWKDSQGTVVKDSNVLFNVLRVVDSTNKLLLGAVIGGGSLTPRVLYDDVAPGDTDKYAWPVDNTMAANTSADKVKLQNTFPGTFRGYGSSHSGFSTTTAAKVWTSVGSNGKEYIVGGKGLARICLCQLTAAQTGGDSSFTVDAVTVMDGGQSPGSSLTVYNVSASAGADNAVACIEFNETSAHWEVQWIVNTSQSVVTDYQIDGPNKKFQKKTRTAWANWAGTESGWTDVHTGGACP